MGCTNHSKAFKLPLGTAGGFLKLMAASQIIDTIIALWSHTVFRQYSTVYNRVLAELPSFSLVT